MAAWPTIAEPIYPIKEKTMFPAIRTEKEGPYMQSRPKWTSGKKVFTLQWDDKVSLPETDYQTLETFFLANQGASFTWTHPVTSVVYTCMFLQDELDGDMLVPGYRTLSVQFRQV